MQLHSYGERTCCRLEVYIFLCWPRRRAANVLPPRLRCSAANVLRVRPRLRCSVKCFTAWSCETCMPGE
eukprot:3854425-Heterocapsa_arctica.AAC.1